MTRKRVFCQFVKNDKRSPLMESVRLAKITTSQPMTFWVACTQYATSQTESTNSENAVTHVHHLQSHPRTDRFVKTQVVHMSKGRSPTDYVKTAHRTKPFQRTRRAASVQNVGHEKGSTRTALAKNVLAMKLCHETKGTVSCLIAIHMKSGL